MGCFLDPPRKRTFLPFVTFYLIGNRTLFQVQMLFVCSHGVAIVLGTIRSVSWSSHSYCVCVTAQYDTRQASVYTGDR